MQPQGKRYVKPQTMALALDISTERLLAKARKGEIPVSNLAMAQKPASGSTQRRSSRRCKPMCEAEEGSHDGAPPKD